MRLAMRVFGPGLLVAGVAVSANADLVYLSGGRTLSVKAHRQDGDRVVLTLRSGGEIVCEASLVERVAPDEVPYPEPVVEPPPVAAIVGVPASPAPFGHLIDPLATRYGVDPALVRAVISVESNFEPAAVSNKGAMGLMQLMPATARQYALQNPFDPASNLDAGIRHLRSLLDRFDLRLALAAYNAGEGAVLRYGGIPPFPETRSYVSRVLERAGVSGSRRR